MEISEKLNLARQQLKSGQLKLAEESSRRILLTDANQPEALHLLGIIYHKAGKSNFAVELITKAIAINSHIPEYHYNLGIIYSTLGKTDDAIQSAIENIEWAVNRILEGEYPMRPGRSKCEACDFDKICSKQREEFDSQSIPRSIKIPETDGITEIGVRCFSEVD